MQTNVVSQPADGNPRSYWISSDGTRSGIEVILPVQVRGSYGQAGINISSIYSWINYPAGRNSPPPAPPGTVVSECDVTIAPIPNSPSVSFYFVLESLRP